MSTDDPRLLSLHQAILPEVVFDGWTDAAFQAAWRQCDLTEAEARALCPRGALDLAAFSHRLADDQMVARLQAADLSDMRFRDKVAFALRARLDVIPDREAVRRSMSLFSLPFHAPEGTALVWGTADRIWTALGDPSQDANWYSKRATLSAVWASVVIYWLGDESEGHEKTDAFIGRRIDDVMQIEKAKAGLRRNPLLRPVMGPVEALMSRVRAPSAAGRDDLPGTAPTSQS